MNIDNITDHILVKSVDEFAAILLRRGYQLEEHRDMYGACYKVVAGDKEHVTQFVFRPYGFLYRSLTDVAEELDRWIGNGQHHVCCAQCKEPLLVHEDIDLDETVRLFQSQTRPLVICKTEPDKVKKVLFRLRSNLPVPASDATFTLDQEAADDLIRQSMIVEYRSAKAGPASPVLTKCPGCGALLNGNTKEINDLER